jgi:2-polyprenyl-6-methoxyphenol hydroxylase-like FAD-dependent oxidoreductase
MTSTKSLDEQRTQVLVVGAGPVGLLTALRLKQQGVDVRLIEQQSEHRAHSFPVVLHPQSLRLLNELGVSAALFWRGRPVTHLAVYTEYERRAVLQLPGAKGTFSGALTLPQDVLRQALSHALEASGVQIEWNTRLAVLQQDASGVWGRLLREDPARLLLGAAAEKSSFEADFVVGADGYESTVREALGIRMVQHGALETFVFFDAPTSRAGSEAHLAFAADYVNSVYPLQGGRARFSFQLGQSLNKVPDSAALRELLYQRMPWYGQDNQSCEWGGVAEFRHALAESFGSGRVWLAGEAAHLTGPVGVQSVNVGLDEGNELALRMSEALRQPGSAPFGVHYCARRQRQWRELLGLETRAVVSARSPDWVRRHTPRLVSCLPASEADLDDLLAQLRLTTSSAPPSAALLGG